MCIGTALEDCGDKLAAKGLRLHYFFNFVPYKRIYVLIGIIMTFFYLKFK